MIQQSTLDYKTSITTNKAGRQVGQVWFGWFGKCFGPNSKAKFVTIKQLIKGGHWPVGQDS